MGEIVARFADGRLLVQESRLCEARYDAAAGVPVRIGLVRQIDKVLSVDTDYSRHGLITNLGEVGISGAQIGVVMRRGDLPTDGPTGIGSGQVGISGSASVGLMSGLTSGLAWLGQLVSGHIAISGMVTVTANVIGW